MKLVRSSRLLIPLSVFFLIVGFQNCSQTKFEALQDEAAENELASTVEPGSETEIDNPAPVDTDAGNKPPETIDEVAINCQNAASQGAMKTYQRQITFANPRTEVTRASVCDWEMNGNLSRLNGTIRSRYEQYEQIALPEKAVVCDVAFGFTSQQVRYDDLFLFTFNGIVLAGAQSWSLAPLSKTSINSTDLSALQASVYDWSQFVNQKIPSNSNSVQNGFCLGAAEGVSQCSWPLSQRTGYISMNFPQKLMIGVSQKAAATAQSFGFVTSGDDDSSTDCQHLPITFTVTFSYY